MAQARTQVKQKILVVEDATPLRNDIIEMLTFEGFDVRGAENGLYGVDMARSYLPDLIVCDIMMPEKNGYEVLQELQADLDTKTIPFIFLTAKTDRADRTEGMKLGADDFMTKPFKVTELLERIHARIKRRDDYNDMANAKVLELSENIITALPHELRTPLNTIMGFSDMLTSEAYEINTTQVVEWGNHINQAAQRLYRLVENYITYARVETLVRQGAKVTDARAKFTDPVPFVEFQVQVALQNSDRLADVTLDIQGDTMISIAEEDLSKIVSELIGNAAKFSQVGTPIKVIGKVEDNQYVLTISDKGVGMHEDEVKNIGAYRQFDRWIQEQQGLGLGLAIVRRLTELYEGEFEVFSRPDEGMTVTITLPLGTSV